MSSSDPPAPVQVYVGIGSNIEPERHLRFAVRRLGEFFGKLDLSTVWRSRAVGFAGEDFLNLVAGFTTHESPAAIVGVLEQLHTEAGRLRGAEPMSPRTLDLDLLLYGNAVMNSPSLPHRDILRYGFVLGPLAELAPGLRHPVSGLTMADLWDRFDRSGQPMQAVELDGLTSPRSARHPLR